MRPPTPTRLLTMGQALQQNPDFPYYLCRNEQGAVHIATATVNRIPVLPLPGDIFVRCNVAPVPQQIESEHTQDISVNDALKPVSRYWDRINRPDQLICSLPEAMRVLTSPAQTGAVTLALPQDVQAEAFDVPGALRRDRHLHPGRLQAQHRDPRQPWVRQHWRPLAQYEAAAGQERHHEIAVPPGGGNDKSV